MSSCSSLFAVMSFFWQLVLNDYIVTVPFTNMEVGKIISFTWFHPTLTEKYKIVEIIEEKEEETKIKIEEVFA